MKPLTISELELLAEDLHTLAGGQVQKVTGTKSEFGIGIFKNGRTDWIWVVLDKKLPLLFCLPSPPPHKKITTPALLFINAHINDKIFTGVRFDPQLGRVICFEFGGGEIEVRLFPHGPNFIVRSGQSQVAWTKIQELTSATVAPSQDEDVRTPGQLYQEWLTLQSPRAVPALDVESWRQKEKVRLEKSLQKLDNDVQDKKNKKWREVGEWIKENQRLDVAKGLQIYVDDKKSVSWNMQNCFTKAKDIHEKIERAEGRRNEILAALNRLPTQIPIEKVKIAKADERIPQRSLRLDHESYASFGKSATDNLKLLRSAKPWHLWLHLKDYPAAHCVLNFPRQRKISDQELQQIATWLIGETKLKGKNLGGTFEVLVTECRFVTPIKGDSLGRVNYRNERVFRLRLGDQK